MPCKVLPKRLGRLNLCWTQSWSGRPWRFICTTPLLLGRPAARTTGRLADRQKAREKPLEAVLEAVLEEVLLLGGGWRGSQPPAAHPNPNRKRRAKRSEDPNATWQLVLVFAGSAVRPRAREAGRAE